MDPSFWHERWVEGRIGFHRAAVNPQLLASWPQLGLPPHSRVLVPLCGKSLDLGWLASLGHEVTGVELSPVAVRAFFDEAGLEPTTTPEDPYLRWAVPGLSILQGDVFKLPPTTWDAFWDRAALIALPRPLRARYAALLGRAIAPGGHGLLVTIDYPQTERDGPPFSVPADEVHAILGPWFDIEPLPVVEDPHPDLGVSRLTEQVWHLRRRVHPPAA